MASEQRQVVYELPVTLGGSETSATVVIREDKSTTVAFSFGGNPYRFHVDVWCPHKCFWFMTLMLEHYPDGGFGYFTTDDIPLCTDDERHAATRQAVLDIFTTLNRILAAHPFDAAGYAGWYGKRNHLQIDTYAKYITKLACQIIENAALKISDADWEPLVEFE